MVESPSLLETGANVYDLIIRKSHCPPSHTLRAVGQNARTRLIAQGGLLRSCRERRPIAPTTEPPQLVPTGAHIITTRFDRLSTYCAGARGGGAGEGAAMTMAFALPSFLTSSTTNAPLHPLQLDPRASSRNSRIRWQNPRNGKPRGVRHLADVSPPLRGFARRVIVCGGRRAFRAKLQRFNFARGHAMRDTRGIGGKRSHLQGIWSASATDRSIPCSSHEAAIAAVLTV